MGVRLVGCWANDALAELKIDNKNNPKTATDFDQFFIFDFSRVFDIIVSPILDLPVVTKEIDSPMGRCARLRIFRVPNKTPDCRR